MRPYADRMLELMGGVARVRVTQRLPLLTRREPQTTAILAVTGDRGLAGGFNAQILRRAMALGRELEAEGQTVRWLVSGRKGRSTLSFRRYDLAADWTGFSDRPAYLGRAGDRPQAESAVHRGRGRPCDRRLQPLRVCARAEGDRAGGAADPEHLLETDEEERAQDAERGDFIYEPDPEEILERLLPVYLETELFRALLESAASEQGARMTAMRNASKNAAELIDSLTLAMNRARQAEITQEILEVVAGADALAE